MRNRMYGGVRGRKMKVGGKLLHFPPTRLCLLNAGRFPVGIEWIPYGFRMDSLWLLGRLPVGIVWIPLGNLIDCFYILLMST